MLLFWLGCQGLSALLDHAFGLDFSMGDTLHPTLVDLSHTRGRSDEPMWPFDYEDYSWALSWYALVSMWIVGLCYVYLIVLLLFRQNTGESSHPWYYMYLELLPVEVNALGMLGLSYTFTTMITKGASFSVAGGTAAASATGDVGTWKHLSSHYYFASFILTSHGLLNVCSYVHGKFTEYVRGREFDTTIPLDGKVYIVTGSNTGLGFHTAKELVLMGATVVMACRTPSKAHAARKTILESKECRAAKVAPSKVLVVQLNLNSFESVRKCAEAFLAMHMPLHGIINNAGLMNADRYTTPTTEADGCGCRAGGGLEVVMTANHLSHFLLSNLLLPELNATAHRELQALHMRKAADRERKKMMKKKKKKKDEEEEEEEREGDSGDTGDADADADADAPTVTQDEIDACFGRIVTLSSALHKVPVAFNFEDMMSEKHYSLFGTYAQSKLANVLFTSEMQRRIDLTNDRLSPCVCKDNTNADLGSTQSTLDSHRSIMVVANSVHPGCVRTEVTRGMSPLLQWANAAAAPIMQWLQKTPREGCFSSLHAATSLEAVAENDNGSRGYYSDSDNKSKRKRGGGYYFHCERVAQGEGVNDVDAKRLWEVSEAYCETKFL